MVQFKSNEFDWAIFPDHILHGTGWPFAPML
jgi:hypothetical protein